MKKLLLILLLLQFKLIYCQIPKGVKVSDHNKYKKYLITKLLDNHCYSGDDSLEVFCIYLSNYNKEIGYFTKNENPYKYLRFIYDTISTYNHQKLVYPVNIAIIYKKDNYKVIAYSSDNKVNCNFNYKRTQLLLDYFIKNDIKLAFIHNSSGSSNYYVSNGKRFYKLQDTKRGFEEEIKSIYDKEKKIISK